MPPRLLRERECPGETKKLPPPPPPVIPSFVAITSFLYVGSHAGVTSRGSQTALTNALPLERLVSSWTRRERRLPISQSSILFQRQARGCRSHENGCRSRESGGPAVRGAGSRSPGVSHDGPTAATLVDGPDGRDRRWRGHRLRRRTHHRSRDDRTLQRRLQRGGHGRSGCARHRARLHRAWPHRCLFLGDQAVPGVRSESVRPEPVRGIQRGSPPMQSR